jgi:hypothetical protein
MKLKGRIDMDDADRFWIKSLENKINQLERDLKHENEIISDLRDELERLKKIKPQEISTELKGDRDFLPIIRQFMDSVESLNAESSKKYESGMNPMLISDFSVDLKTKIGEKPREEMNILGESDIVKAKSDVRPDPDEVQIIRFSMKPIVGVRRIE